MAASLDVPYETMETDSIQQSQRRIAAAYLPERLQKDGRSMLDEMAAFLMRSQRCEGAVLNWRAPLDNIDDAAALLDSANSDPAAVVRSLLSRGQTIHDPRYMGHQVAPPLPLAALLEAVSGLANQGMTIYEMGPWSSAVERAMVSRLGTELGLAPGFGGIVTSGGSLANLTALLTARNRLDPNVWKNGATAGAGAVVLASEESHYSIRRAAGILGIGTESCLPLETGADGKVDPRLLAGRLATLRQEGRPVVAVVASACSTRCGLYDQLDDIGAVCESFGVWFHVDAAHGGAAVFSPRYSHYLRGIERADSVIWDAHKMLFIPALSTYLFYKRANDQYLAANQLATYLFDSNASRVEAFNTGLGTVECTKRAAAFSLWGCWSVYGKPIFRDLVEATFGTTRLIAARMKARPDFELLYEPEANILVFRYVPEQLAGASRDVVGAFQATVRQRLIESGEGYIVPATDGGDTVLRMVIMNPLTTVEHFDAVADALRRHGEVVLAG